MDTQATFDEGLIVLVHGAAVDQLQADNTRSFVLTFFLGKDPEEGGFFIRNTMIRFLAKPVAPVVVSAPVEASPAPTPTPAEVAPAKKERTEKTSQKTVNSPKQQSKANVSTPTASTPTVTSSKSGSGKKKDAKKESVVKKDTSTRVESTTTPEVSPEANHVAVTKSETEKTAESPKKSSGPKSFLDVAKRPAQPSTGPKREKREKPVSATVTGVTGVGAQKKEREGKKNGRREKEGREESKKKNGVSNVERVGGERGVGGVGAHINSNAQCYVSNIAFTTTDKDLIALLNEFGKVKSIVRPPGKGYGFVEFVNGNDAKNSIKNTARVNLTLDGRDLKIEERTGQQIASGVQGKDKEGKRAPRRDAGAQSGGGGGGSGARRGDREKK